MKKYGKYIVIMLILATIILIAYFLFFKNSQKLSTPEASRTQTEVNVPNNITKTKDIKEEKIAHFSTKIFIDDNNRDNNMELTASKVNGTIVKNGETFSFNETVGNPTPDRGYEKAGVFVDGKKVKGYGGGNCQVSTTIYDAVLQVKELEVTERHEHGKDVGYVKQGKDATVAYDDLDLKFKNNTGYDIKIYAKVTKEKVDVSIMKLS